MVSGYLEAIFPAATREFAPLVEELLNDSAIQATYKRSSEQKMLPGVATYFIKRVTSCSVLLCVYCCLILIFQIAFLACSLLLKFLKYFFPFQAVHILRANYEPTDQDILYAEGDTSSDGLACVDFSFPQSSSENGINQHDSLLRSVPVYSVHTFQRIDFN